MTPNKTLSALGHLLFVGALVGTFGCKPKVQTNQDLLSQYTGDKYTEDMVATEYRSVDDQGDAIDPRTLAAIEDAITTVYVSDFEKCLEKEMSRLENRWIAGSFSVEFTIEPSGMVSSARMLSQDIKERRTLNDKGEYVAEGGAAARPASEFTSCAEERIYKWEFDPAPEVTYTHSYNGQVGEAW
jgi:hypothetical protein